MAGPAGPTVIEAAPFNPYADAQGRDVGSSGPSVVQPPKPTPGRLIWMQQSDRVAIVQGRFVVMAQATRAMAVCYTIFRFFIEALDRGEIEVGNILYDGSTLSRCITYTGTASVYTTATGYDLIRIRPPGADQGPLAQWALFMRADTRVMWADMLQRGKKAVSSHLCHNSRCLNPMHYSAEETALNLARNICAQLVCHLLAGGQLTCPCSHPLGGKCMLPVVPRP